MKRKTYNGTKKTQLQIGLFIVMLTAIYGMFTRCQAQEIKKEDFKVEVGATSSYIQGSDIDFGKTVSFYAGIGLSGKLTSIAGYGGDLQYISEKGDKISVGSINSSFYYKVYTIKNLFIIAGFQIGLVVHDNVPEESTFKISDGRFSALTGLGYEFGRVCVVTRYGYQLSDSPFMWTSQVGLSYKLNK